MKKADDRRRKRHIQSVSKPRPNADPARGKKGQIQRVDRLSDKEAHDFHANVMAAAKRLRLWIPRELFDDVVQQTILKGLRYPELIRSAKSPRGLASKMLRTTCVDLTRRPKIGMISAEDAARVGKDLLDRLTGAGQTRPFEDDEPAAISEDARASLAHLNMVFPKEMAMLRYWYAFDEKRTRSEVAVAFGVSERCCTSRKARVKRYACERFGQIRRQVFGPDRRRRR